MTERPAYDLGTLGGRLSRAREDARFKSQEALTKALNARGYKVARPTISRWEDGTHSPPPGVWPHLSALLGVEMRDIFFGAVEGEDPEEAEFLSRMRGYYRRLDLRGRRTVLGVARLEAQEIADSARASAEQRATETASEQAALERAMEVMAAQPEERPSERPPSRRRVRRGA